MSESGAPADIPRLSIVIPAYNEEARIGPTLTEYAAHFNEADLGPVELIVVLNGCRDDTRGVVRRVMEDAPQVRMLEFPEPLGKGGAIWEGLAVAQGQLLLFADADNMVRAAESERIVRALGTHDIAMGDRLRGVEEGGRRTPLRWAITTFSRLWVRLFLGIPYRDTQCGAKAFRSSAWRAIASHVKERGWAFDLDVLAQARVMNLTAAEVPVRWHHVAEGSKVRPLVDVPKTFAATFGIRSRARRR